ncbi:MAG: S8 family serine peptidase [Candidatus Thorarchaeota archaeon]
MYRRYLILLVLLIPGFVVPTTIATKIVINPVGESTPLIEPRLRIEMQNSGTESTALLEFREELTSSQIKHVEALGVSFTRRGSTIVNVGRIYSAKVSQISDLYALEDLGLVRATSGTKQFVPSITSSVPTMNADDVWNNIKLDGTSVDGTGVKVAILDTGISWMHPSFWRQSAGQYHTIEDSGNYYVDLDDDSIADANEGPIESVNGLVGATVAYSADYMYMNVDGISGFSFMSGDRWLGGIDANDDSVITLGVEDVVLLDVSKVVILYDQPESRVYVRGVNLTLGASIIDPHGHGTHVASVVAGGQIGFTSYVGVAPGADLIVIKSDLQSADILDGISFAVENDADIINMSFSSYLGFLDGTDIEDLAVSEAFLRHGVVSVTAAGNLGDKNKHARFLSPSGNNGSATFNVNNAPDYSFLNLLWHSSDRDERIILTTPTGVDIDLGQFSLNPHRSWELVENELKAYAFTDISAKGLNNLIIQVSAQDHTWADGSWTMTVDNPSGESVWIDAYTWDGQWDTTNMRVSSNIDSGRTISSPGTADLAITVAAFSESSSSILSSSSKGPRVDGVPKPTIAAPGYNIRAASSSIMPTLWVRKDGTSMATPHVSGAMALIRQASGESSAWQDYSALVDGAGASMIHYDSASSSWGYGLVDALHSVRHVLESPAADASPSSNWVGIPDLFTDPDDLSLEGGLDITSAQAFIDGNTVGLAVVSRGIPNYSGSNVLSIGWDSDSNPGTGQNGADYLVNITGGVSEVFEWGGSSYYPSSLTASWWVNETVVIVRIDGVPTGTRGDISASTHNTTLANADQAGPGTLVDFLRPMMSTMTIEFTDGSFIVGVELTDRDTPIGLVTTFWNIVDGPLNVLNSSSRTGASALTVTVPPELVGSEYVNSLLFNITSEALNVVLPPLILSTQIGPNLIFTSASLDHEIVRVGLFMSDRVSGELILEGFVLATLVYIAFESETGSWLNLSLSSGTGVYNFDYPSSYFQLGSHEVYAVALGLDLPGTELLFATLTIVQDYTIVTLGAVALVVGVCAYVIIQRRRGKVE